MIYFKACPRCHGAIEFVDALGEKYLHCITCSFTVEAQEHARELMQPSTPYNRFVDPNG